MTKWTAADRCRSAATNWWHEHQAAYLAVFAVAAVAGWMLWRTSRRLRP
jgi:ABC-type nickel/cobalt efflux system permease component RcnA